MATVHGAPDNGGPRTVTAPAALCDGLRWRTQQLACHACADGEAALSVVIAHRGASGYLPEHTLEAYALAVALGADFIEPDLVATADGVLVARPENELSRSTDVAMHGEFAARRTAKRVDGVEREGWFSEDFTLAELRTLRAREPRPELRPHGAAHDGRYGVPTFGEILALARESGVGV